MAHMTCNAHLTLFNCRTWANEHRPWQLYQSVFFSLLEKTRFLAATNHCRFRFKAKLYCIEATVVDLCLSMYEWAHFRRAKGTVKLHLRLDHDGYLPDYVQSSRGNVTRHDWLVSSLIQSVILINLMICRMS
jgi:hypothetical protein